MENIYAELARLLDAGDTVAVATIVDVRGSVPREVGAKMLIHPLGKHVGTVGGGCGEGDVIRTALDVLQTGEPATVHVDLTEDISMQALGVCGGIMDVFIERAAPADIVNPGFSDLNKPGFSTPAKLAQKPGLLEALRDSVTNRIPVALATVVQGERTGRQVVIWLDRPQLGELGLDTAEAQVVEDARAVLRGRQHKLLKYGDYSVFVEVQRRAPELLIVGGGHIALPLARLASMCDFSVAVLDDRPGFVSEDRFPTAARRIAGPLRETVAGLPMDQDTYIVLVTRGHSHDVECLLEVLDRPVGYIGMIGSQRRVDAVFQLLVEEMGIPAEKLDRVYAPIGIAIGARTPAEIAVCIMAEIINVLRNGPATSISDRRRERDRRRREAAAGSTG